MAAKNTLLLILSVTVSSAFAGNIYTLSLHVCDVRLAGTEAGIKLRMHRDGETCESPLLNEDHMHLERDKWYHFNGIPCDQDWLEGIFDYVELLQDGEGLGDGACFDWVQVHAKNGKRKTPFSATR